MDATLHFLLRHGYLVLFIIILLEQAGLPIPSLPLLLAAGALAAMGRLATPVVLAVAVVACVLSDAGWFLLGRNRGGRVLSWLCKISLEPDSCVRRTEEIYFRHGARSLLVAKFIPGFSAVSPPLAGIFGMPWRRYLLYDAGGALAWSGTYFLLGYALSNQLGTVARYALRLGAALFVLLVAGLGSYLLIKYRQRQKFLRELHVARITPQELKRAMDAGEKVVVVDLRHEIEFDSDPGKIPGAMRMHPADLEKNVAELLGDGEIVLYCTCPNEVSSARVAMALRRRGIVHVRPLEGGLGAWKDLQYPMELPEEPAKPFKK